MGHTYFNDDDDAMDAQQAVEEGTAAAVAASVAPSMQLPPRTTGYAGGCAEGVRRAVPLSSVRVDYNASDPCYVLRVQRSPDGSAIAAALSNGGVKVYAASAAGLAHAGDIAAHAGGICDMSFPLPDAPHALFTCGRDSAVRGWDLRTRAAAESFTPAVGRQELNCFALLGGQLLVAGGAGNLLFWDRRSGRQLAVFDDTHMDDVTQVAFHEPSARLLSASQDGLVAVHDTTPALSQDDGFVAAINAGTSVEELGLYGADAARLWLRTGTEGLQLWDWAAAADEAAPGGDVAAADLPDARRDAGAAAAAAGIADLLLPEVHYLIGCHWDAGSEQLLLLAGDTAGTAAFFPLDEPAARAAAAAAAAGGAQPALTPPLRPPPVVLTGAHTDIVRGVHCFSGGTSGGALCVSGGEDARLVLWTLDGDAAAAAAARRGGGGASPHAAHGSGAASGPARRGGGGGGDGGALRRSPY